jgi:hypothetical protein
MIFAAILRASASPIAEASPMWYQRGLPPREYTAFHAR